MAYKVLSQKYRPSTFREVIGQESVTRTLTNAIESGRIANAYIFSGPRGTGKTSVARLLSKALNCASPKGKDPCGICDSCREISGGNSIDVLEIDGASNRGIDEIRALRDNVKFSPSTGRYKMYIIDEVHMLTTEAFNALLKTLEEPPGHVKFIFATTEPHKVLPTIMSRCQRFDFKKISARAIYEKIEGIAEKEKIEIEDKAALLIAKCADGSMRDALVILDQMVSFSAGRISRQEVMDLLGMVHRDAMFELAQTIIDKIPRNSAKIIDELISGGKDPVFVGNSLISHFRDLMILKTAGDPTSDMAFSEDELDMLNGQKEKLTIEEILYILQSLSHCMVLMKGAMFARAPLEIAVIKLAKRQDVVSLPEILSKLENIRGEGHFTGTLQQEPRAKLAQRDPGQDLSAKEAETPEDNPENEHGERSFEDQKNKWKSLMNYVRNKKMSVFTFLSAAIPLEISDGAMVIGFDKEHSFNKEVIEAGDNKALLQEAADKVMGKPVRLQFRISDNVTGPADKARERSLRKEKAAKEMKPVIEKAMDVFGGHVVRDLMGEQ